MSATWVKNSPSMSMIFMATCMGAFAGCSEPSPPTPTPQSSAPAVQADEPTSAEVLTNRTPRSATPEELDELLEAAAAADEDRVTQLVNGGLDINQQNGDGETALMRAAANGHNGYVVTLMTVHKADPGLRNKAGKTAEDLAWDIEAAATARAIADRLIQTKSADQKLAELLYAAAHAHTEHVEYLVKKAGMDINQQNADGETALMQAAANGHPACVTELLTIYKADSTLRNKAGKTAEELAREKGQNGAADVIAKQK